MRFSVNPFLVLMPVTLLVLYKIKRLLTSTSVFVHIDDVLAVGAVFVLRQIFFAIDLVVVYKEWESYLRCTAGLRLQ